MRICRYTSADGAPRWGVVSADVVSELAGDPYGDFVVGQVVGSVEQMRLLSPCEPTKIIGAGRNYWSLLAERGWDKPEYPSLFFKSPQSVVGCGSAIVIPNGAQDVAYEGELAVVIGKVAKRVPARAASSVIAGYTCANDVSIRDWLEPTPNWIRAKAADTHCPLGPWMETDLAADDVPLVTRINGEVRQDARTSELVFSIAELIEFISADMTLNAGDVVLTGCPAGVGPMHPGDVVEVTIDGLGTLYSNVMAESDVLPDVR